MSMLEVNIIARNEHLVETEHNRENFLLQRKGLNHPCLVIWIPFSLCLIEERDSSPSIDYHWHCLCQHQSQVMFGSPGLGSLGQHVSSPYNVFCPITGLRRRSRVEVLLFWAPTTEPTPQSNGLLCKYSPTPLMVQISPLGTALKCLELLLLLPDDLFCTHCWNYWNILLCYATFSFLIK